jgi:hypothetical protein
MPGLSLQRQVDGKWTPATREGMGIIDHESEEFVTAVTCVKRNRWTWSVSWIGAPLPGATVRICAVAPDGSGEQCSEPFDGGGRGGPCDE